MKRNFRVAIGCLFCLSGLLFFSSKSDAQVNGTGPSNPALFDTVLDGTQQGPIFNVLEIGGVAGETTQLNLSRILSSLILNSGSEANISAGGVTSGVTANSGSEVNLSGGIIDQRISAAAGSQVNISGGIVGGNARASSFGSSSPLQNLQARVDAAAGATVNLSGGGIGLLRGNDETNFNVNGGTFTSIEVTSETNLSFSGSAFQLDGNDITSSSVSLGGSSLNDLFTGVLADGSSFILEPARLTPAGERGNLLIQPGTGIDLIDVNLIAATPPPIDTNPIVVNTANPNLPSGLRAGQTLVLQDGGELERNYDIVNATINIEGGTLRESSAAAGSNVNISGGAVDFDFTAYTGTAVDVSGGEVVDVDARDGSTIDVSGGQLGRLSAFEGSQAVISGGNLRNFDNDSQSDVEFVGGEFKLNGVEITSSTHTVQEGDTFSGTLADGSAFAFSTEPVQFLGALNIVNNVALTNVALPAIDTDLIVVDSAQPDIPFGLREGQSLLLTEGGALGNGSSVGDFGISVVDASLEVVGGEFGGGEFIRSDLSISGGATSGLFELGSGSEVNISGGLIEGAFITFSDSFVNISGGDFAADLFANAESTINLLGSEFSINGVAIGSQLISQRGDLFAGLPEVVLTGTLLDGSDFELNLDRTFISEDATITASVISVPEPNNLSITVICTVVLSWRRRTRIRGQERLPPFLDLPPFLA